MVPLYAARIADFGPGDFVRVECTACGHEEEARREGLSPEIIETIRHRRDTSGLDQADAAVIELGREIFTARKVKSATFACALELFGRKKLVDLVALMGNYAATAAMLTAFDMQLDPDQPPPLPI
jgi:4-carboxymuconolactone decarboxylase